MNITGRVQKLERNETLAGPRLIFDKFQRRMNDVAFRLQAHAVDDVTAQRVIEEAHQEFVKKLSTAELKMLVAKLTEDIEREKALLAEQKQLPEPGATVLDAASTEV